MRPGLFLPVLGVCGSLVGTPASADPAAEALLERVREATARVTTLRAEVQFTVGSNTFAGRALLKRPNLARVEMKGLPVELVVSDGKSVYSYQPTGARYVRAEPGEDGTRIPFFARQLEDFFHPRDIGRPPTGSEPVHVGRQQVDGVEYEVVEVEISRPLLARIEYYISPRDYLVHQVATVARPGQPLSGNTAMLRNVQLDPPVADAEFRWTPPETARNAADAALERLTQSLLKPGEAAPEFRLPLLSGGELSLSAACRDQKALLLVFWRASASASQDELVLLEQIAATLKMKGVAILAINVGDDDATARSWWTRTGLTLRTAMAGAPAPEGVARAYQIQAVPTLYLIGPDGTVRWAGIGSAGKAELDRILQVLTQAGIR